MAAKDENALNLHTHLKNKHPEEYDIVQRTVCNTREQLLLVGT